MKERLAEVSYEPFLRYQNDMEDLLPEKEGCEKDSDIDSDDENQQTWSLEECHFAQHPEELSSVQIVWTFSSFSTELL